MRWSDLPTSQYTTSFGEGNLQGIMSRINDYVAKLVDRETETSTFQVFLLNTPTVDIEVKELPVKISPLIPFFSRIQSVTVDQTGTMFCSCKQFERMRLPCVHMACVAKLYHETKSLDLLVQNFLDLHMMILRSVVGVATCIMPTNLQHHHTLLRNITCWQ
jgi:hypothetical protein